MDALVIHRLQFAFTAGYHYLYPQLTMGLALLIVIFKSLALFRDDEVAGQCARFWIKIFGVNFVMGVVTGIPMEFQFGTNWARFSEAAGGVIGQTLAMEGMFAFFLESAFLYLLLFQEERLGPRGHWGAAVAVFVGSWLSGYFIVCTNAFMQHPVGHAVDPDGTVRLVSLSAYLLNPWAWVEYTHTMIGSVVTASFVVCSVGSFYLLQSWHVEHARKFLRVAVPTGLIATVAVAFPTGDLQAKFVAEHQPVTFAAMEGLFDSAEGASIVLIGQPDMETLSLDNPVEVPKVLSFLTHRRWSSFIPGLKSFPQEDWPDNVPMLYYAYHIMVGLGTIFIAIMAVSAVLLAAGRLFASAWMLWILMLSLPFPYIANTAGWMTAELGRQPWLLHGIMRTADGSSINVSSGNVLFTLLGFMGLYAMLSVLFLLLASKVILAGPTPAEEAHA